MAKDFFGNLGQALSKTAKELSGRAEDVYETQRLKNKISAEERQIDKIMADLGKIVYQRYKEEVPVDDAQKALCEQIDQRMEQIEQLRTDINELKIRTRRICPSCGKEVEKNAAFCKFCGAACPTQEEEEDAGDTIDGTAEEVEEEKSRKKPQKKWQRQRPKQRRQILQRLPKNRQQTKLERMLQKLNRRKKQTKLQKKSPKKQKQKNKQS